MSGEVTQALWRSQEDHVWIPDIGTRSCEVEVALETPKMLEMPELWDTCQGKLLTGNGTSPRERSLLQSTKLKELDIRYKDAVFRVHPAGFLSCFGPVFPHYDILEP